MPTRCKSRQSYLTLTIRKVVTKTLSALWDKVFFLRRDGGEEIVRARRTDAVIRQVPPKQRLEVFSWQTTIKSLVIYPMKSHRFGN